MANIDSTSAEKLVKYSVPDSLDDRERTLLAVRTYVAGLKLVPPLSFEELQIHAEAVIKEEGLSPALRDFVMVLTSNEVWRDTIATIPFERRILLMPQCLRSSSDCPAEMDEFGLLCQECGRCPIGELQSLAEELGYMVLVAEGTTVVVKLLEQGKVDAVVGVSCLSTLEHSFPYTAANAIPGMAIPLFVDGCTDTKVDVRWVRDAITLASDSGWSARLDLDEVREEVKQWFAHDSLVSMINSERSSAELIGLDWIVRAGKRWRPFLVACTYKALNGVDGGFSEAVQKLSVAVECFHKASLVHDDIEDSDDLRYDEATMHVEHGIPIALNVGDLILGIGYDLISNCGLPDKQIVRVMAAASEAHRKLCVGQGEELAGMQRDLPVPSQKVIDIFRLKTSPAFSVALKLGAIAADCDEEICRVLDTFSDALGVAYQIKDDLADMQSDAPDICYGKIRPSLLFSLAFEHVEGANRARMIMAWRQSKTAEILDEDMRKIIDDSGAVQKAEMMLEHFKNEAVRSLNPLQDTQLKTLLRRIVGKILGGV